MERTLKPFFQDPELEKRYGDRVRRFIAKNIPERCMDWTFHFVGGSQEIEERHLPIIDTFVMKGLAPKTVLLTGVNGATNKEAFKAARERPDDMLPLTVAPDANSGDAILDANELALGLADKVTIFEYNMSTGALGMLSSCRLTFHKEPDRRTLK